jgi:hypothetical protein
LRQSVDGDDPTVCKPRTSTCQAQSDFSAKECSGETPQGNAECGAESVDDAWLSAGSAYYVSIQHNITGVVLKVTGCKNVDEKHHGWKKKHGNGNGKGKDCAGD